MRESICNFLLKLIFNFIKKVQFLRLKLSFLIMTYVLISIRELYLCINLLLFEFRFLKDIYADISIGSDCIIMNSKDFYVKNACKSLIDY